MASDNIFFLSLRHEQLCLVNITRGFAQGTVRAPKLRCLWLPAIAKFMYTIFKVICIYCIHLQKTWHNHCLQPCMKFLNVYNVICMKFLESRARHEFTVLLECVNRLSKVKTGYAAQPVILHDGWRDPPPLFIWDVLWICIACVFKQSLIIVFSEGLMLRIVLWFKMLEVQKHHPALELLQKLNDPVQSWRWELKVKCNLIHSGKHKLKCSDVY